MSLNLTVKRPGNLLGVFLRTEITEQQYAQIVLLLSNPDKYQVTQKPTIGFKAPA
jgi:hypothetical protein